MTKEQFIEKQIVELAKRYPLIGDNEIMAIEQMLEDAYDEGYNWGAKN